MRAGTARIDDDFEDRAGPMPFAFAVLRGLMVVMLRNPRDSLAAVVAGVAVIAILVNALFMQTGPHPAPIFANKPLPAPAASAMPAAATPRKGVDTVELGRPRSDTVVEIQRELSKRGFYSGPADGTYGPKTDTAIRDFEQVAGMRPSAEPNDVLLASIIRSTVKAQPVAVTRNDPIAALLAPNPRTLAVQRALTDFGYGPVKPSGIYDAETRTAVERFEKARHRTTTGQISDQLVRDLSALTGRPLE
jgi:peptidoglycan hydrolase-like protein with peptidoglycan-binding domain